MDSIEPIREDFALTKHDQHYSEQKFRVGWNLGLDLGVLVSCGVTRRVSSYLIFGVVGWFGEEWKTE